MSPRKGFTLIELLVVIAIIGTLSSLVVASVNTARTKASDAAVKAAMKQIVNQAAIYIESNPNFSGTDPLDDEPDCEKGVFNDPQVTAIRVNILSNADINTPNLTCNWDIVNANLWALSVNLRGGGAWCVDNSGNFKVATAADGLCP